jgi:hypothetical protein
VLEEGEERGSEEESFRRGTRETRNVKLRGARARNESKVGGKTCPHIGSEREVENISSEERG